MSKLTVNGKTAEFTPDKRLVLAIEELGIAIGHRCGGKARCTTCRVTFLSGEPLSMTRAEYEKLKEKGLLGHYRLACQLLCSEDMELVPEMTLENQTWTDTGPKPGETVEPEASWFNKSELEAQTNP
jgi:ferredoxin